MTRADGFGPCSFPLTRADLVRYAGASGDYNPIHWSDSHARRVGLADVIAHGMLTLATATRAVTDWAGDPGAVREIRARFTRSVVVPDSPDVAELAVRGTASASDDGRVVVDLSVTCGGADVLAGARVVVAGTHLPEAAR